MHYTFQAWKEFLARYLAVFRSVWAVRAQLDPPSRSGDEYAFLPAQLELVETPVNPAPRWGIGLIVALFVVGLCWAVLGKLDIVAIAAGKTVPGGRTKIIQPLETAVVKAIHVSDGQHVQAGQLLIELDGTGTAADARKAGGALSSAQGSQARYRALLAALDVGRPPKPFTFPGSPAEIETENALAQSEFRTYLSKRESLGSQLAQRQAELATTRGLIIRLAESASIAQARSKDLQALLARKFVSQHDYLTQEQARISAERDLEGQRSRVFELQAAIDTQRDERLSQASDFRRQITDGLRQASDQAGQYSEDAGKSNRRNQLMRLTAPVAGTVQQLAIHTVGGVVTPAQPLLAIVPEGETLEVEALVENKDIGFVRAGQEAVIKIESFPYTRYGYLTGKVVSVSHDAIQDEKRGLVYQAKVRMDAHRLNVEGTWVNLSAGMAVSAEIKTGKRRVITYLLSPLQQHSGEALRER